MNSLGKVLLPALLPGLVLLAPAPAQAAGEYEPNNDQLHAAEMGVSGTTHAATLESTLDLDWFGFYVAEPQTLVTFTLSNTTPASTGAFSFTGITARIYDAEGRYTDYPDVYSLEEQRSENLTAVLDPGRYYLRVEPGSSYNNDSIRTYTFTHSGNTVDAATGQAIHAQAAAEQAAAATEVKQQKAKLKKAKESKAAATKKRREIRRAKKKIRRAKKQKAAAKATKDAFTIKITLTQ